jgi:multicomponent Na+:H+ antiporter subunit F
VPDIVFDIAAGWATLLLLAGGLLLLHTPGSLHRVLALDVLVVIVIALLATLSYVRDVSYYIDAALGVALLALVSTLVAARYVTRGGPF